MSENEAQDAETRALAYQELLDLMRDPDDDIITEVERVLPSYLSDQNPRCQGLALSICDMYLKSGYDDIDYDRIVLLLIKHCLNGPQQNADVAASEIETCLRNSTDSVVNVLFQDLAARPTNVVIKIIAIIVSFMANLTAKDAHTVNMIKMRLEPLATHIDFEESVHKEAASAIAAAKIILGNDMDTVMSPKRAEKKAAVERWIQLIESRNWKDRKVGYEELLDHLSEESDLRLIEKYFLIQAGVEKYTLCEVLVAQIIDKMACVFKNQLLRKLREYMNPIINLLKSKRQSRMQTFQKALDSIAVNVAPSPYEQPFLEILLSMMKSTSAQLREESLNFIQRMGTAKMTQPVKDQVNAMMSDQLPSIRKLAQALCPAEQGRHVQASRPVSSKREIRKKGTVQGLQSAWNNWVEPETLELLQNTSQWVAVTKGLEQLKRQFEEDPSQLSAVVGGFSSMFIGKTFTPKVMASIMGDLLFYMRYDPEKLSDEALQQTVAFSLDKIQDKKFENQVYEILDTVAETNSAEFVFQLLYPHLSAKNPTIPLRITQYFHHHLETYGADAGINVQELSDQLKPLFTHANLQIRSTAVDIANEVKEFDPSAAELFKQAKGKEKPESKLPQPKVRNQVEHKRDREKEKKEEKEKERDFAPVKDDSFIPQRLIQAISKTGSIVETRKGLDEIENILGDVEPNTVHATEFLELFAKLRQWFKDSSTNIVLSVIKVITGALKSMKSDEIETVPTEFFCDMCLLLNFAHRGIRQSTVAALTELFDMHKSFFSSIFIPSFFKLNSEGRRMAVTFLKNMQSKIQMTIEEFGGLVMNILHDKSDEFRELAKPILIQFFQIPGALEAATDMADQLPPAQKNLVLSRLPAFQTHVSLFKSEPTNEETEQREEMIDPFLPLKVLNFEEKPETLTEVLKTYSQKYFRDPITDTDTESVIRTCEMFLKAATEEYESFSMILDIVFLWWANQALLIKVQEGFNVVIDFLTTLLHLLNKNERVLDKYEFSIILPTILECLGRDEPLWEETRDLLFQICDDSDLVDVCVELLSMASSVYTIVSTFKTLKLLSATNDLSPHYAELLRCAKKINGIVENDADKKELYDVSSDFLVLLKSFEDKSAIPKPKYRRQQQQKESPKSSAIPKFSRKPQTRQTEEDQEEQEDDVPKMPSEVEIVEELPSYVGFSNSIMSEDVLREIESPAIRLYQWIADINSSDYHQSIAALKCISAQLKDDWSVFADHSDALVISLLAKMHVQFETTPLPIRLCKYVSFCIVTLISNEEITATMTYDYATYLINEVIKILGTGVTEPVVNQVLNAILMKLIESSPERSFSAVLNSLCGPASSEFSDKQTRLAIKCLEASGVRLCECGEPDEIAAAMSLTNQFFEEYSQHSAGSWESKIAAALKTFAELVSSQTNSGDHPNPQPVGLQAQGNSHKIVAPDFSKKHV